MYKFTVSTFIQMMGITRDALYLYEEKGLLKPYYVDPQTRYRYYSPTEVITMSSILLLKSLGFTISEIKNMMSDNFTLDEKYNQLLERRQKIDQMIENFNFFKKNQNYTCYEKMIPEHYCISKAMHINDYMEVYTGFADLVGDVAKHKLKIVQPCFVYTEYNNFEFNLNSNDIEIFICVQKSNDDAVVFRPRQKYICTLQKGDYVSIENAYAFLKEYAENNNIKIIGKPLEHYINSYGNCVDINEFVTEICFQIE